MYRKMKKIFIIDIKISLLIKINFFKGWSYDAILISNKISSVEKNYKYFIGYMDDNYKIKPFNIILPKTSPFGKLQWWNGCIFWMKMMNY